MNVSVMDDTTDGEYWSPERVAPLGGGGGGWGGVGGGWGGGVRGKGHFFSFDVVVLTFSLVRTQVVSVLLGGLFPIGFNLRGRRPSCFLTTPIRAQYVTNCM